MPQKAFTGLPTLRSCELCVRYRRSGGATHASLQSSLLEDRDQFTPLPWRAICLSDESLFHLCRGYSVRLDCSRLRSNITMYVVVCCLGVRLTRKPLQVFAVNFPRTQSRSLSVSGSLPKRPSFTTALIFVFAANLPNYGCRFPNRSARRS